MQRGELPDGQGASQLVLLKWCSRVAAQGIRTQFPSQSGEQRGVSFAAVSSLEGFVYCGAPARY